MSAYRAAPRAPSVFRRVARRHDGVALRSRISRVGASACRRRDVLPTRRRGEVDLIDELPRVLVARPTRRAAAKPLPSTPAAPPRRRRAANVGAARAVHVVVVVVPDGRARSARQRVAVAIVIAIVFVVVVVVRRRIALRLGARASNTHHNAAAKTTRLSFGANELFGHRSVVRTTATAYHSISCARHARASCASLSPPPRAQPSRYRNADLEKVTELFFSCESDPSRVRNTTDLKKVSLEREGERRENGAMEPAPHLGGTRA